MNVTESSQTTGVQFTETMRGYFSTREKEDCEKAAAMGRQDSSPLEFTVTIVAADLDQFINSRFHEARMTGTVKAPELSTLPLSLTDGKFNLFVEDLSQVNTKRMAYSMPLSAADGKHYYLTGYKTIRDDPGFDIWSDTTTLRFQVFEGQNASGLLLGAGVLKISVADFAHQLTTFKSVNARNRLDELRAVARFGSFFAGSLYETYGGILTRANIFSPDAPPREKRKLDLSVAPTVFQVDAGDGVMLRLTRYQAGRKGPVMCVHGLGVSSKIFSTDLIDRNLLEELAGHGYDVWLLDYRSSIDLPYATLRYTADDIATKDFPAAVRFIQQTAAVPSIQCLVHCFGATTFFMAMLAGLQGVRSAAVSQIATHMKVPFATEVKTELHAATLLDRIGVKKMTAYVDTHESFLGHLADMVLKLYPVHSGPRDISPVSRRISFLYGQLYELDQLNERTYDNLHELFGVAGISSLEHLATMIRQGHIVNFKGDDIYLRTEAGMPTLKRLAIPIAIAHGALNKCWLPASTEITFDLLSQANGPAFYERKLFPNYGHIDCIFGKNAARDVYPFFVAHLEKTARD
jgi:cholesterol oxidase